MFCQNLVFKNLVFPKHNFSKTVFFRAMVETRFWENHVSFLALAYKANAYVRV
jgi:hypothetical protein